MFIDRVYHSHSIDMHQDVNVSVTSENISDRKNLRFLFYSILFEFYMHSMGYDLSGTPHSPSISLISCIIRLNKPQREEYLLLMTKMTVDFIDTNLYSSNLCAIDIPSGVFY